VTGPKLVARLCRAFESLTDSTRLLTDTLIREHGLEWERPESVLSEEEREAILARQMGRTLAEIDELPERGTG
jgi:hypothetical protein